MKKIPCGISDRIILILFCILSVIAITGCASGPIGKLPIVTDRSRAGEVTLIRTKNMIGITNSYVISLDNNDIFNIRSGQYTKFELSEGEHSIAVKCFGGWSPTWKENSLKFLMKPNNKTYFLISPNMDCAKIVLISENEAQGIIQESEYMGE